MKAYHLDEMDGNSDDLRTGTSTFDKSPTVKRILRRVPGLDVLLRVRQRLIARKRALQERFLRFRIDQKWKSDASALPLTDSHYPLYTIIHKSSWRELQRFPNLHECEDLNDKLQWLKLFDQREEIVRCVDKIGVRDYVRQRVGEKYLVPLYQVCQRFEEIDFEALPDSFVIKTNHDSGSVILVRDKLQFDYADAESQIETSLRRRYGWENGEWAYSFVRPRILVEEFIAPDEQSPPPDYKFYVVDGRVKFIHFIYGRGIDPKEQILDPEGTGLNLKLTPSYKPGDGFMKPACWKEMKDVAEELGKGFKFVRIDLFQIKNRIYTGEMTFWPWFGCYKGTGQRELGNFLNFDRTTFRDPVYQKLMARVETHHV